MQPVSDYEGQFHENKLQNSPPWPRDKTGKTIAKNPELRTMEVRVGCLGCNLSEGR